MDADEVEGLEKNKRHTIEVVVDRIVLKQSTRRRLSDSVSTAVKLTEGFLLAVFPDDRDELLYSELAACHQCGISMPALSTQLFSFNNPQGACSECGGLGVKQFFDRTLIIPDETKSILDGAIAPWGWRNESTYTGQMLAAVADHYKFSLQTPFKDLSVKHQDVILYGSGKEEIHFLYQKGRRVMTSERSYEGVIPQLDRRFHETQSGMIRDELGKYMAEQICPVCKGAQTQRRGLGRTDWRMVHIWSDLSLHREIA